MFYFTKPTGGMYAGKKLLQPPPVVRSPIDAPLRLAFIADLHVRRQALFMAETAAEVVAGLKPDAVLVGGDMAECDEGETRVFSAFRDALGDTPILAVPGNNDDVRFDRTRETLRREIERFGARLLLNECARLTVRGVKLEIAGVEDGLRHEPDARGLFSEEPDAYRVLLSHAPHAFLLKQCRPNLMLSGHTHGGQWNLLGLTPYSLPFYEHKARYTHLSGVRTIDGVLCAVTNGVGYSRQALRIGSRPDVMLAEGREEIYKGESDA